MKRELLRLSRSVVLITVLCGGAGCSTISIQHQRTEEEGSAIRGSERYEVHVTGIEQMPAGTNENIVIKYDRAIEAQRLRLRSMGRKDFLSHPIIT